MVSVGFGNLRVRWDRAGPPVNDFVEVHLPIDDVGYTVGRLNVSPEQSKTKSVPVDVDAMDRRADIRSILGIGPGRHRA